MTLGRQIVVAAATGFMFLAVLGLARMAAQPDMALLYSGLEPRAAGDIVAAIESRGLPYEVQGGAILVPRAERDALRLMLASEGLPANSAQGYELLDTLTGFGTTSQMFDAAYWRAKEGELARTILANPQVTSARVHIAVSSANPLQREVTPSASVSITGAAGAIGPDQARAIRFLVASAVPGLEPADVSVIDSRAGLLGAEESGGIASAEDRSYAIRDRVQRLVEARVGLGNAVVAVSVDTVNESESIRERRLDPDGRVVISSDTEERNEQSTDQGGGSVTIASNLPDGEAGGGEQSSAQQNETRERVNYEVSETTRELTRAPGAIRRLSVAVLVNGRSEAGPDGAVFVPLPEAELVDLRDLVASAVGFDAERRDEITIRSMPFDAPEGLGTEALSPDLFNLAAINPMQLLQLAMLALVALGLGLFVIRPVLSNAAPTAGMPAPPQPDGAPIRPARLETADPRPETAGNTGALTGEIDTGAGFQPVSTVRSLGETEPYTGIPELSGKDPVDRLRGLIAKRRDEAVEILRSWLDEREEEER